MIGTGPSLTLDDVEIARRKGFALFGCNRVWEDVPDLSVLWATNGNWWTHYWSDALMAYPAQKWTVDSRVARKFGINSIGQRDRKGLSTNPDYVHHGHGSGYSMLNLAYLMGARRIVLLGYDLKYAPDYDGADKKVGSAPRHYFGEYPSALLHWPKVSVRSGVHVGLLALYEEVAKQAAVEIINCSPDTALTCFPRMRIADVV